MEYLKANQLLEHLIRIVIMMIGIGFAVYLGKSRPEWRSRKTLICWVWTIGAVDLLIMDGNLAKSLSAQLFIGGALILNVINFIGDRIETIKFKDFSASLKPDHSMHQPVKKKKEPIPYVTGDIKDWPDGGEVTEEPVPEEIKIVPPPRRP